MKTCNKANRFSSSCATVAAVVLLLLNTVACRTESSGVDSFPQCLPRPLLADLIDSQYVCQEDVQSKQWISPWPHVIELNETLLNTVLDLVKASAKADDPSNGVSSSSGGGGAGGASNASAVYVAVLYYATWCPFSQRIRPLYHNLSALFPAIPHVAVEESRLRPSVLSRFGVLSFPAVYVHTPAARFRYYGPASLPSLASFYTNVTGIQNATVLSTQGAPAPAVSDELRQVFSLGTVGVEGDRGQDSCPCPWAFHPDKLFHEHTCLALASAFLALRVLWCIGSRLYRRLAVA